MITTEETLIIDGVTLNTMAYNVKTREGRYNVPARKGGDIDAIADHGAIPIEDRPFQPGRLVLGMWILGCNEDGEIPLSSREHFEDNRNRLLRLFARGRSMSITQVQADGTVRQCRGKVADAIDMSSMAGATRAEMNVLIDIPAVFWEDPMPTTTATAASSALPKTLTLNALQGATAPSNDAVVKVTGPITAPRVQEPLSLYEFSIPGTVPSGQIWEVDSLAYTSKLNGTNNLGALTHKGGARFMSIEPRADGSAPTLILTGSGASSLTKIECTAKRKYL